MTHFQAQRISSLRQVEVLSEPPAFALKRRKMRGAMGRGLRYEGAAKGALSLQFGGMFLPAPWFRFKTAKDIWSYAQPDGLIFNFRAGTITVVEIKYNHCAEAYFQLMDKYIPLLEFFFNRHEKLWKFIPLEFVYWFDKMVSFPTEIALRKEIIAARADQFSVHIWRPQK